MINTFTRAARGLLLAACGAAALPAVAQGAAYPNKPIRIIVGSPAGGGGDAIARLVTQSAAAIIGQPFIIENRAGAGGNIGADQVAKSTPDGYTLLLAYTGHVVNPGLYKKLPFDPIKDFTPVMMLARNQSVLIVRQGLKASTLGEFLALAREAPGKLTMAALPGSSQHLAGELMKSMANVNILTVPYRGNSAAFNDVIGGQVDAMFSAVSVAGPFIKSGKVRALAIAGASRSSVLPDIPTVAESGLAGFASEGWYGLLAPGRTPRPIVEKLRAAFSQALEQASVKQAMATAGNESANIRPDEFESFILREIPRWTEVIRRAKIEQE